MADSLQIRRGNKDGIPTLADGEPGYCKDTRELYIGPDKVAAADTFTRLDSLEIAKTGQGSTNTAMHNRLTELEKRATDLEARASNLESKDTQLAAKDTELANAIAGKLTASPAASAAELWTEADLDAVIAAYNSLLSALKAAGIMST